MALSNSFLGNTWRQTMVRIFQNTAKQAQSQGLIKSYKVENAANGTATEQIAQLKSLILQHVNAILIDAASADALNPTIKQACNAGITVVVFDSLATEPCAYKLEDSIAAYGFQEGNFVGQKMGGKGNLLMVRGVVGSAPEKVIYDNQLKALKKYPGIKIVRSLVGQASNSVTQQAVAGALPSLPPVQGVVTGGSSLGAVQAFQSAHKPIPVVAFDNSGEALRFWQAQHQKNGYEAVSVRTEPGQAAAAFWLALDVLQGNKVPNKIYTFPNVVIKQADLGKWLQATPNGSVAAYNWTRPLVQQALQAQESGQPVKTPPIPTSPPGA
ncbi:MAG TPA: ABC transporter substrate-binding protein [Thermoleophilaceae bacterium]|nr:ABC transporter substrate-binding protein [Thermoleophilaceae bacterium]